MGLPPVDAGAVHLSDTLALPEVPERAVGADGALSAVVVTRVDDPTADVPALLVALRAK